MGLCWCSQVDDGSKRIVMPANDVHLNLEIKGCSTAEDVMRYVFDDIEMPKPGKSHMRVNGVCTSLLYGEILPEGIMKAMDLLGADNARSLLDVGSGRGTLAFFTFLCYPQITQITGVEISDSRFSLCTKAMKRIPCAETSKSAVSIELAEETGKKRRLSFYKQDIMKMLDHVKRLSPDIVIFDVEINFGSKTLIAFLKVLKPGCCVLSYEDLNAWWTKSLSVDDSIGSFPFTQFGIGNTYQTSWAPNAGYKFMTWRKKS
mmetsp:Transcript_32042/g.56261  ORF Transcript_32042/g.56261 Transcript_32042/m.56261 type:complete len:260 (+) Transcript_32042:84-863(+)|eukprot:CAMPEP_0197531500 /NCGR_PEP_ID=MMETSP1318-20131121/35962_1 /TAXON_ID=552666 /ORGANISM="Partenskyella glossopodia, Strain RCC365" /LENGTH=259 /DNA_ID=CAMNT_0043087747 /DNA_START=9 /DNA_END=788 /DNA_ORIENTATION=+